MTKCPDCGGTYVRCMRCGTQFDTASGVELVLDILRQSDVPIFGTRLAELSGYSIPGMYNALDRLISAGRVERVGNGKQRKGYRLARTPIPFPEAHPLELAQSAA